MKWLNEVCIFPQQVKSDTHQSRLALCDMPNAAISPTLPFSGTSPPPELDVAFQHAEGNGNRDFLPANSVSKSETQEQLSDKPACVSVPAAEVARVQDYPSPQPIPEGKSDSPVYKRNVLHS